jgi:hypothetical protein
MREPSAGVPTAWGYTHTTHLLILELVVIRVVFCVGIKTMSAKDETMREEIHLNLGPVGDHRNGNDDIWTVIH